VIEKWNPTALPRLDVLFASLPTGTSAERAGTRPKGREDRRHRRRPSLCRGLGRTAWPTSGPRKSRKRPASPTPAASPRPALTALAPLLADNLVEPGHIVIDAKTGHLRHRPGRG
jgi:N-acetyl-gamma-glutamyl-phosphate reductase